jgi:hypothetical protein
MGRQKREIQRDEMRAGAHERLGGKCAVALAEQAPRAAMNEHMDRRIVVWASVEIDGLGRRRSVGEHVRLA